ncbi:MAG TPA: hypothetical protein VHT71_14190 [Methylomirabilota bacterium]|jgi:hypothetical protein|nr:hypothetical protein [Methylomirabilota bacterium]
MMDLMSILSTCGLALVFSVALVAWEEYETARQERARSRRTVVPWRRRRVAVALVAHRSSVRSGRRAA